MNIYVDDRRNVWLSYGYLKDYGIPTKTIWAWKSRHIGRYYYFNNRTFIDYDTIPEPTRKLLPNKECLRLDSKTNDRERIQKYFFDELKKAYDSINVARWRNEIRAISPRFKDKDIDFFARRAAVFERALNITNCKGGELECLHKAYLQLFPDGYSMKNRFRMALTQAKEKGILSVAVNYNHLTCKKKTYTEEHEYYAMYILSHNKGYSVAAAYEMFYNACDARQLQTPGFTWFREFRSKNKNLIEKNSLGKSKYDAQNRLYATIIPAEYSGDQWQIDGWEIPVYCKKYTDDGKRVLLFKYVLFAVLDTHSRKIIGFDVAESENTETILKGLERAVKKTSTLPYEIVSDNHSFHKTDEAGNLKEDIKELGVTWTVDSNPRRKSILERAFRTLGDSHYKNNYGYIGQGIKTKIKNGITQQELLDIYTKPENMLSYDQIVAMTAYVIDLYNGSIIKKLGNDPDSIYRTSERPHAIPVDDFLRLKLFIRKSEHKITHGQITIQRGMHRYEYQLPAQYSEKYNNKIVGVRYENFEKIYLYDSDTDKPIYDVPQKPKIHGALANQTQRDKELLYKNSGRIKGIEAKGRKKKEKLRDAALLINPNAYEHINKITTPKDILHIIKQKKCISDTIAEIGVNPQYIQPLPVVNEMLDPSMNPPKGKDIRHLYHKGDTKMRKISIKQ